MDLNALAIALQSNVNALIAEARKAEEKVRDLPETPEDVAALLDALAAADEDCAGHFSRFPREGYENRYETDEACKADWTRVHDAREKAVRALTRFAVARKAAKAL